MTNHFVDIYQNGTLNAFLERSKRKALDTNVIDQKRPNLSMNPVCNRVLKETVAQRIGDMPAP